MIGDSGQFDALEPVPNAVVNASHAFDEVDHFAQADISVLIMLDACLLNPILYCCFENVDFYVC